MKAYQCPHCPDRPEGRNAWIAHLNAKHPRELAESVRISGANRAPANLYAVPDEPPDDDTTRSGWR